MLESPPFRLQTLRKFRGNKTPRLCLRRVCRGVNQKSLAEKRCVPLIAFVNIPCARCVLAFAVAVFEGCLLLAHNEPRQVARADGASIRRSFSARVCCHGHVNALRGKRYAACWLAPPPPKRAAPAIGLVSIVTISVRVRLASMGSPLIFNFQAGIKKRAQRHRHR